MYLELLLHLYVFKWQHVLAAHVLWQLVECQQIEGIPNINLEQK
jgi:hypothetical protein